MRPAVLLLMWTGALVLSGCSTSESGITVSKFGQVEIHLGSVPIADLSAPPALMFEATGAPVGTSVDKTLSIINTSTRATLTVAPLTLTGDSAYTLVRGDVEGTSQRLDAPVTLGAYEALTVTVRYSRLADWTAAPAQLLVETDTRLESERRVLIPLGALQGVPVLNITPRSLDFRRVALGETKTLPVRLTNTGSAVLRVPAVTLTGAIGFSVEMGATSPGAVSAGAVDGRVVLDPPLAIAPGAFVELQVSFTAVDPNPAQGDVAIETNASAEPEHVALAANASVPCLEVLPHEIQFGAKLVGAKAVLPVELRACGSVPVQISGLTLAGDDGTAPNPAFSLAGAPLPAGVLPTEDAPLRLPPGGVATVNVVYVPDHEALTGQRDEAWLRVESDGFEPTVERHITGLGTTKLCPTASGRVTEGEQVIPQTTLHLDGTGSFAVEGAISKWAWRVLAPEGSVSQFVPSAAVPSPIFDVNVAGTYTFALDVFDELGAQSCVSWEATVLVVPSDAIHVELLWHTPSDPDESDEGPEAGSDLDLHFVDLGYVNQADPWFDPLWDTFWFNAHPNWGAFTPPGAGDPGLDRDDTDGGGPENLNLAEPQDGHTYLVGVHHWQSHGYGDAYATVRIYLWQNLVAEFADVRLSDLDMWCVATIEWPSGKVTICPPAAGAAFAITPNYTSLYFSP